jgi:hypothetical protein
MSYTKSQRNKFRPLVLRRSGCCKCGLVYSGNRVTLSSLGETKIFCEVHIPSERPLDRVALLAQLPQEKLVYAFSPLPQLEES